MMRIFINSTEITNFNLEVPFTDTLDKTLDAFSFIIRSTSERSFSKYSRVRIVDSAINFEKILALQSYTSKLEGNTWIYNINCISPTKILENIVINGMADTYEDNPNHTGHYLGQQLSRIVAKINKQSMWENGNFYTAISIRPHLQSWVSNKDGSNFKWEGLVTAREILDDILEKVDSYVVVTDFEVFVNAIDGTSYIPNIYIDYVRMNGADINDLTDLDYEIGRGTTMTAALQNIDNTLPDDYKIANYEEYNESEYDISKITTNISNSIPNNYLTTGWTKARSESLGVWTSKNVCLVTDEPIYDVDKENFCLLTRCQVSINYVNWVNPDNPSSYTIEQEPPVRWFGFPLPIGDYIYEKAEYDNLPESEQRKALYFERGKKNIYGFTNMYKDNVVGQFNFTAINNIINDIMSEGLESNYLYQDFSPSYWFADYIQDIGDIQETYPNLYEILNDGTSFLVADVDSDNSNRVISYQLKHDILMSGNIYASVKNDRSVGSISTIYINSMSSNIEDMLFSVRYIPYVDTVIKSTKKDNDNYIKEPGYTHGLSILQNQTSQTLDLNKFCNYQQSLINRLGERIAYLDVKINASKGSSLWPLGNFIRITPNNHTIGDCWKIVQRELTQYNENTYKVRYTLAKNFNGNNASIDMDRAKRTFDIPLDGYIDRYIYVKVPSSEDLSNYDAILTQCRDYNMNSCYSWNNITKFNSNNTAYYKSTYLDNYSANIYFTKIGSTKVNAPLRYCNDDGKLTDLNVALVSNLNINRTADLMKMPRVDTSVYYSMQKYSRTLFGVDKDKYEKLIIIFYQDIED